MQKKTKEMPERQDAALDSTWDIEVERRKETVLSEKRQINLSDFALFLSVMKIKEAYEDVLGIILDEPDLKLKEVKVEQVILNKSGLDNSYVTVKDERILHLDRIVNEVKQSEEWEAVEMSMKNFHVNLKEACEGLEISVEEYERAKRQIAGWEEENSNVSVSVGQEG